MSALERKVPPPVLVVVLAAAMWGAHWASVPSLLPWPARLAAAVALFVAAGFFGPPAIRAFGRAATTINPVNVEKASALVTTGVFGRTRNPMYVSMTLLLGAWAAWLGQAAPLLGPVVFVLYITWFQIMPEERALARLFGAAYDDYRRAVRRWV